MGIDAALFSAPPFIILNELPAAEGAAWSRIFNDALAETLQGQAGLTAWPWSRCRTRRPPPPSCAAPWPRLGLPRGGDPLQHQWRGAGRPPPGPLLGRRAGAGRADPHSPPLRGRRQPHEGVLPAEPGGQPPGYHAGRRPAGLGGVFDRFPGLKVCLSHAGGYFVAGWGGWITASASTARPAARAPGTPQQLPAPTCTLTPSPTPRPGCASWWRAWARSTWCWAPTCPLTWATRTRWPAVRGLGLDAAATGAIAGRERRPALPSLSSPVSQGEDS